MEWLAVAALIVLGVPAAAWLLQDGMIFFSPPPSGLPVPAGVESLEVRSHDDLRLQGWFRRAIQPEVAGAVGARAGDSGAAAPLILLFGGNAEEISAAVFDRRWPRDWSVAAFNYRGYGASEGRPSERALTADALVVHDALLRRADVDAKRVVLFGRSLGSGIAVKLAAQRPPAGVVLVSPYDSLIAVGRGHYPWLPVATLLRHRFEAIESAPSVQAPLLALVARDDRIIPAERSRALVQAWGGPARWREFAEGADHNTLSEVPGFWHEIDRFLSGIASPPGTGVAP